MLGERPEDLDVPQLRALRPRPALEAIKREVAAEFGVDAGNWRPGRRSDDAGRAVAAYLARRRFGYSSAAVAGALGYRDHGGVGQAVRRVEQGTAELQQALKRLEKKLLAT
jgi:chromosomal replication initiation ATPase DnaA